MAMPVFGQGTSVDTTKKEHNNIISFDVTSFIRQFATSNSSINYSPYMLSYRRIIKNNAIKLSVGGVFVSSNGAQNDTLKSVNSKNNYYVALGFEHYSYLSKRWTFYYGIDLTTKYLVTTSNIKWSSSHSEETKNETIDYGFSPTLGIVFEITKRMSIATETSYNISYQKFMYTSTNYQNTQTTFRNKSNSIHSTFYAPTTINFRFKF